MLLGITCHGVGEYGITLDDQCIVMQIGEMLDIDGMSLEIYEIMGFEGLDVRTDEGLFSTDIRGSGVHKLTKVETPEGELINA